MRMKDVFRDRILQNPSFRSMHKSLPVHNFLNIFSAFLLPEDR
jgi:hypothetical protein